MMTEKPLVREFNIAVCECMLKVLQLYLET